MIKAFLFENFKSFDKARLDLENLTILIGSNSGGKTNAIEGIRILSEIATGSIFPWKIKSLSLPSMIKFFISCKSIPTLVMS